MSSRGIAHVLSRRTLASVLLPLALALLPPALAGCKGAPPVAAPAATTEAAATFPPRPAVAPPAFKVFHQDDDTYTLVTKENATDDEVAALLWQFRDAAQSRGFDALHLSQKFIDARQPKVWFHVYRGSKCASEKFGKGAYPCGASYHGAGDFTLGSYKDPHYNEGLLLHADGSQTRLWDADRT